MPNINAGVRWSDNTKELARNMQDGLNTVARTVSQVKSELKDATTTLKELEKSAKDWTTSAGQLAVPQVKAELDKQRAVVAALKDELDGLSKKTKPAADGLKDIGDKGKAASDGLKSAGDGAQDAAEKAARASANLKQVASSLQTLGTELTAAVTVPVVGAAAASVKFATEFETNVVRLHTLSGVTKDDMEAMRKAILDIAPAVGIGPGELSKAMLAVTSTGIKGKEAIDILTAAAKASAVGLGDTTVIARTLTSIIQAYGAENISAAKATEIMFKTVKDGNAEASELAGTLGRVIGIASQVGVSFEDVGTFIATFTRLGVSSAEAVTALRGVLSTILKPAAQSREALESVGLSVEDLRNEIQSKGLTATLLDLTAKFKGNEEGLAHVIPNIRALSGVLGTAGSQAASMAEIEKHLKDNTDEMGEAFGDVSKTTQFQFNQLKAELEKLAVEVGTDLLPQVKAFVEDVLKPGVHTLEDWVRWFEALPQPIKTFAEVLVGLGAAGGPVLLGLGTVAKSIAAIQTLLYGANAVAETSVFAALLRVAGVGAAAGASGAAAEAGSAEALAQLTARVRGAGGMRLGLPGWMSFVPVGMGDKPDLSAAEQAALTAKYFGTPSIAAPNLAGPGLGAPNTSVAPVNPNDVGFVAGGVQDLREQAAATQTVLEQVKALTEAQRDDILSKHQQGEAIRDISKETGIATNVIAVFLRQMAAAGKAGKQSAKDIEEAWKETVKSISDSERTGEQGIQAVVSGLKGGQNVLRSLSQSTGTLNLDGFTPVAKPQDFSKALQKSFDDGVLLMPDLSQQAQKHIAELLAPEPSTFETTLNQIFDKIPSLIERAVLYGHSAENLSKAIGTEIGKDIGQNIAANLAKKMGEDATKGLSGALLKSIPVVGSLLGPLLGKLFSIGGPSQAELAGRQTEAQFEQSFGGFDKMVNAVGAAYVATGRTLDQARADVKALLDAEAQGPAATQAWIDKINAAFDEQKQHEQDVTDGVTALTEAWGKAGTYIPQAQQQAIANLLKMNGLTDDQRKALQNLLDSGAPSWQQLKDDAAKYGIEIAGLGPKFRQNDLDADAKALYSVFQELTEQGADVGGVLVGMKDEISALVQKSKDFGVAIPENMKPLIEELARTGQLLDANGNKITDLSDLSFEDSPLDKSISSLDQAIQHLADVLNGIDGKTINTKINTDYTSTGTPPSGIVTTEPVGGQSAIGVSTGGLIDALGVRRVMPQYFDDGGRVHAGPVAFMPLGTDTVPAMLTPGELVLTAAQESKIGNALQAGADMAAGLSKIGPNLPASPVVLQEHFAFDFSGLQVLDGSDLDNFIERKAMPRIVQNIEERRRGYTSRIQRALKG